MIRPVGLRARALFLLALAGCHFRAGFGPPPQGPPSVDHSVIRDTVEASDGTKTVNENDTTTTKFDDGRSSTLERVNVFVTQPNGSTSRNTTETKTERSANGSVSTSSSSSSGN
jgi:hypothetical protein